MQPHNFTDANHVDKSQHMNLEQHMMKNKEFAIEHDIPIVNQYSVAPHHSGTSLSLFLFIQVFTTINLATIGVKFARDLAIRYLVLDGTLLVAKIRTKSSLV